MGVLVITIPHNEEPRCDDLVRFVANSTDDLVSQAVKEFHELDDRQRDEFRRQCSNEDAEILRLYTLRRALFARRSESLIQAQGALDGFHLMGVLDEFDGWRDLQFALFVARSLGADLDEVVARARKFANRKVAAEFPRAVDALQRSSPNAANGKILVTTSHGEGILMIPNIVDEKVWRRAPVIHANPIVFEPASNLAGFAAALADRLENQLELFVGPLQPDALASVWFGQVAPGSYVAVSGCISLSVFEPSIGLATHELFVCELPNEDLIDEMVREVNIGEQRVSGTFAASRNRTMVLVVTMPSFDETIAKADDDASIASFAEVIRGVLSDAEQYLRLI